ncbi:hypothetical protein B7494_g5405 [Chlorociboria aeruginascens]|nr:hypothetical protein B7494_g5405 [Chlorociboria aeruginascens]
MATGTVTIDKTYFETLLRRAQFHTNGLDFTTPMHLPTVTIPKVDHDSLRSLYGGGLSDESFNVLIKDSSSETKNGDPTFYSSAETSDGDTFMTQLYPSSIQGTGGQDYTFGRNANYTPRTHSRQRDQDGFQNHTQTNDDSSFVAESATDGFYEGETGNNDSQPKAQRQHYDKHCKRTILLANLHENTTHSDIVDVVRGGMLLDIYLRTPERTASVSFLEEAHAQDFFRHAKRHDLYIRGKRVEIRWNDRQFILPGHVASKIGIGATRNLVIFNRNPKHTEKAIRDDLEHIHNLVIIKVSLNGTNVYISTNSVHNAMFARTCMMSRATYKGSKVEWYEDECAAPLETLERPLRPLKENQSAKKKKNTFLMNRFQLLNMDGSDDGSEQDENNTSGMTFQTATLSSKADLMA